MMPEMAIEAPQDKTFVDRAESLGAFLRLCGLARLVCSTYIDS